MTARLMLPRRPAWVRALWVAAGVLGLVVGAVGVVLPLLPTTPFVLLAAFCFARGSERCEQWLLTHPRMGPMVRRWRERRVIPLRAKQIAWASMAAACAWAWWAMDPRWAWVPTVVCAATAAWMARLPSR